MQLLTLVWHRPLYRSEPQQEKVEVQRYVIEHRMKVEVLDEIERVYQHVLTILGIDLLLLELIQVLSLCSGEESQDGLMVMERLTNGASL